MEAQMPKYSGFLPYVYNRIRCRRQRYRYQELRQEPNQRRIRKPRRIRLRAAHGASWGVRIPRRIKVLSPIRMLKSMKDAYVNMMFALATKLNVSGNWESCAPRLKGCLASGGRGWGGADVNLYVQYLKEGGSLGSQSDGTL